MGTSPAISVLIIDDHDLFRVGLATMLDAETGVTVVAQSSLGSRGVRLAHELRPDVVLMDANMPDVDGIVATRQIISSDPSIRVIVLGIAAEEDEVSSAVIAGACGYVLKDTAVVDLVAAVRAAANGESWLAPRAATAILDRYRREYIERSPGQLPRERLSPREIEILRLVAQGLENAEIAEVLGISSRTAKNHISSVLAKLDVTNRVQAAVYAYRSGLA